MRALCPMFSWGRLETCGRLAIGLLISFSLLHAAEDPVLKAMKDELQRSMTLQFNSLEKPYYIDYLIEDGNRVQITGMLDGLFTVEKNEFRIPRVRLRVG